MVTTQDKNSEYSVFSISGKLFALEISSVKEVLRLPRITRLPNTLNYVLGIYNLRGEIISLFNIQQVLGLGLRDPGDDDMVVVIGENNLRFSFFVDKVMDFVELKESLIQPPENGGDLTKENYVSGIYQHESLGQIFLLDHNILSNVSELVEISV